MRWAAGWILLSPVLAYLLRPWLMASNPPLHLGHNPSWEDLSTPFPLLGDLFLTGYYPVFQWLAYLLVGLVIGRLALTKAMVPVLLLTLGTAVAALAKALGTAAMESWGGRAALEDVLNAPDYPLHSVLQVNLTGIRQEGSWWWLASAAPHSGHQPGPCAHLRSGGGRGGCVPAARQAGRLGGPGPAACRCAERAP